MNPTDKKLPGAIGVPQPTRPVIAQLKNVAPAQRFTQPVAPPVYRPQPQRNVAQTKTAVAQAKTAAPVPDVKRPVAPPVFRPQAQPARPHVQAAQRVVSPLNMRPTIQCAAGGKAGVGYTSIGSAYGAGEVKVAMGKIGLKGVKGHRKGKPGSKVSGQTKVENAKLVTQLRADKKEKKERVSGCRRFHNKRNAGKTCPTCGAVVD